MTWIEGRVKRDRMAGKSRGLGAYGVERREIAMRLLITLDGSELAERALQGLAPWARTWGAEVSLLTVLDPRTAHEAVVPAGRPAGSSGGYASALATRGAAVQPPPTVVVDRGKELEGVRINTEDGLRTKAGQYLRGVPYSVHACFAENAADGIATFVRDHSVDFVALSTHGRSGLGQALVGSVAGAVVRHSPVPVILVGPDATLTVAPDTSRN